MAGGASEKGRPLSAINVTPFVDIVLVLLVVLMVSSVQIVKASLTVDLPRAAAAGAAVDSTLNVVIQKDGTMLLDGVATDEARLAATVRAERARNPKLQAVIAADKDVAYQRVMTAIDIVKSNGVKSFALNIDRSATR